MTNRFITIILATLALAGVTLTVQAADPAEGDAKETTKSWLDKYKSMRLRHSIGLITKMGHRAGTPFENYIDWGKNDDRLWDPNTGQLKVTDGVESTLEKQLDKLGIKLPKYSYLTNSDDSRISTDSPGDFIHTDELWIHEGDKDIKIDVDSKAINGETGKTINVRRPTHVTEHTVYAMPGQSVYLMPYTDFDYLENIDRTGKFVNPGYEDTFIRWYDYATDAKSPNISFNREYRGVLETEFGHLGGSEISKKSGQLVSISSVPDYLEFVRRVNAGEWTLDAELLCDLDFTGVGPVDPIGYVKSLGTSLYDDKGQARNYRGTFNGNGHTIYNLTIDKYYYRIVEDFQDEITSNDNDGSAVFAVGMFGRIGPGMRLYNLIVDKSCTIWGNNIVGLIGGVYAGNNNEDIIIENVINNASINYRQGNVGGLIGSRSNSAVVKINNCGVGGIFTRTVTTQKLTSVGAFVGWGLEYKNSITISNSYSTVTETILNSNLYFLGNGDTNATITNSYVYGISESANGKNPVPTRNESETYVQYMEKFKDLINGESMPLGWKVDSFKKTQQYPLPDFTYSEQPQGEVVHIYNADDYINFASRVNGGTHDLNAILEADIDFSTYTGDKSYDKVCIGKDVIWKNGVRYQYCGSFDGKSHTIKGLQIVGVREGCGLFGYIGSGFRLSNLIIDASCSIESEGNKYGYVGLIGKIDAHQNLPNSKPIVISNVVNNADIKGPWNVGGIIGGIRTDRAEKHSELIQISNCAIGGKIIGGGTTGAFIGFLGANGRTSLKDNELSVDGNYLVNIIVNSYSTAVDKDGNPLKFKGGGNLGGVKIKEISENYPSEETEPWVDYVDIKKDSKTYRVYHYQGVYKCLSTKKNCESPNASSNFDLFNASEIGYLTDKLNLETNREYAEAMVAVLGDGWKTVEVKDEQEARLLPVTEDVEFREYAGSRLVGAYASHTVPENVSTDAAGYFEDIHIAADISQTFTLEHNITSESTEVDGKRVYDKNKPVLIEPIVAFRHIFTIKDARKLADDYFNSDPDEEDNNVTKNEAYIKRKSRSVSARTNADFSVRLEFNVPDKDNAVEGDGKGALTNRYFKVSEGVYKRIKEVDLKVYNLTDKKEENPGFEFGGDYLTPEGRIDRVITCSKENLKNPKKYRVSVVGTIDEDGNPISDFGDSGLCLAQYVIDFQGPDLASMIADDELYDYVGETYKQGAKIEVKEGSDVKTYPADDEERSKWESRYLGIHPKYYKHSPEYLEDRFNTPLTKVDFDEYYLLQKTIENKELSGVELNDFFNWDHTDDDGNIWDIGKKYYAQQKDSNGKPVVGNDGLPVMVEKDCFDEGLYYFKWPLEWNQSSYGFGYKEPRDFSSYRIANNSDRLRYRGGVKAWKYDVNWNFPYQEFLQGVTYLDPPSTIPYEYYKKGLYDRLYYRWQFGKRWTQWAIDEDSSAQSTLFSGRSSDNVHLTSDTWDDARAPKGYFYYVNAAGDPGEISSLEIGEICHGAKLYISAWICEMSMGKESNETGDLIFNFQVKYKDLDENGEETGEEQTEVIHSFISGPVPKNEKMNLVQTGTDSNGEPTYKVIPNPDGGDYQGKWMHIYYTFVPNTAKLDGKKIIGYELNLENNAKNSHGADYAIDDVRVYMEYPNVYTKQSDTFCLRDDAGLQRTEVEVAINFDSLLASVGLTEDDDSEDPKSLYYCFLDKELFDQFQLNNDITELSENSSIPSGEEGNEDDNSRKVVLWYPHKDDEPENYYGEILFYTKKDKNSLRTDEKGKSYAGWKYIEDKADCLIFYTQPKSYTMAAGKEYYVSLYIPPKGYDDDGKILFSEFKVGMDCERRDSIQIVSAGIPNYEGYPVTDNNKIRCCVNQVPILNVDLFVKQRNLDEDNNETSPVNGTEESGYNTDIIDGYKYLINPPVDWFYGTEDELKNDIDDAEFPELKEISLKEILEIFRMKYCYFGENKNESDGSYTHTYSWDAIESADKLIPEMIAYLKKMIDEEKLRLGIAGYDFIPRFKENGEDITVCCVPFDLYSEDTGFKYNICNNPLEFIFTKNAPSLNHGFSGIDYPMEDVPIRLGLPQIRQIQEAAAYDDDSKELGESGRKMLSIPLRKAVPSGMYKDVNALGRYTGERNVNDSSIYKIKYDWEHASEEDKKNKEEIEEKDKEFWENYYSKNGYVGVNNQKEYDPEILLVETNDPAYEGEQMLQVVGYVEDVKASFKEKTDENENNVYIPDDGNEFLVTFKKDFEFHEGYTYKMRFGFSEVRPDTIDWTEDEIKKLPEVMCGGTHTFTIKIVPEYLVWDDKNGTVSNWNNDGNWKYATSSYLFRDGVTKPNDADKKNEPDYYWDKEKAAPSYTLSPLDFTKVIIPNATKVPVLNTHSGTKMTVNHNDKTSESWVMNTGLTRDQNNEMEPLEQTDGASLDIEYDLTAFFYGSESKAANKYLWPSEAENGFDGLRCRPWYMNTCEEIHFKPESEIGGQWNLDYHKAWVDVETEPNRWYTLASPLQGVVAGDFYLPTKGARQDTPLFKDITFDFGTHNRFKPAVFQRGWSKSIATVYQIEEVKGEPNPTDVHATGLEWSHVYNDVNEPYGKAGTGFSIKTDLNGVTGFKTPDAEKEEDKGNGKVLFRLPKADDSYEYYSVDANNIDTKTVINRWDEEGKDARHRLYDFEDGKDEMTVEVEAQNGSVFLVGNPFMAHLNMAKFLETNSGEIEEAYWIMDGDHQTVAVLDDFDYSEGSKWITSKVDGDPSYLAPLQGFFVIRKGGKPGNSKLTLKFTSGMAHVSDDRATGINGTRSGEGPVPGAGYKPALQSKTAENGAGYKPALQREDVMRITSIVDGREESAAVVRISEDADKGYAAGDDALFFDMKDHKEMTRVYTVAGNMAALVNSLPSVEQTEIGVMAPEGKDITLRFDGISALGDEVTLYDAKTGESRHLYDGMEVTVSGPTTSRLYLKAPTSGVDTIEDSGLSIRAIGSELIITSETSGVNAIVCTIDGRVVHNTQTMSDEVRMNLASGMYVVKAVSGNSNATAKIIIY